MSAILICSVLIKAVDLTYLSRLSIGLELAPYHAGCAWQVVKASSGHIPQPFLISSDKELVQI